MRKFDWKALSLRTALTVVALAGPTAFPLSQMGYGTLHDLAEFLLLPSIAVLAIFWGALKKWGRPVLARAIAAGAVSGAAATLALEAVRYPGFRLGFMPGNLPELMGVLLLDRFALGPTTASTLAGFAYHFWNGAAFGIVFALLSAGRSRWWAIPYGIAIGVGFLVSPVVQALGVGIFGKDFGWYFAAIVLVAHTAFGASLGLALRCFPQPIYENGSRAELSATSASGGRSAGGRG